MGVLSPVIVNGVPPSPKARMRTQLMTARRNVAPPVRRAEAHALCTHLALVISGADTVAAYVPLESEPGSLELLDTLLGLCLRILLPVARTSGGGVPLPLRWGEYRPGELVAAPFGLLEPAEPWLPATALSSAQLLLIPSLAVDRHGVRLGRGAGFYDRSLSFRDPTARLVAVVRDEELVDELPAEPHDIAMTHALTPGRGLVALA
jgi:5-formyltetrahydrofolate cyclo-ligase